ncbi:helix-turn-helix domain-containing protein [Streptomyces sp. NPDC001156]
MPLQRRPSQPFKGDERIATRTRAVELYEAGHTTRCVAEQIGRPWSTTRQLLAEAGTVFRPRGSKSRCTADH